MAEDLTYETFLASLIELGAGARPEAPLARVLGIARNKLLDHHRAQERFDRSLRLVWAALGGHAEPVESTPWYERSMLALAEVLSTQRTALVMHAHRGVSEAGRRDAMLLAVGAGFVWTANFGDGSVSRVAIAGSPPTDPFDLFQPAWGLSPIPHFSHAV